MTYPSLYSIVQFKPYRETDEFANVGVVLCCPSAGFMAYRLNMRNFARINHFFNRLEPGLTKKATQYIDAELRRVQELAGSLNSESLRHLFLEATKHREGIILFGKPRPILLEDDLDTELQRLFDHHVGHSFAQNSSPQVQLEKQMRKTLVTHQLAKYYTSYTLSGGLIEAKIPFVSQDKSGIIGAIKPLNLRHDSPSKIIEEGDKWFGKLRRLVANGAIDATRLLLPIAMPTQPDQAKAANMVICEFGKEHIATIDATDQQHLLQFAREHAQ